MAKDVVRRGKLIEALGYMRTSSASNVGADKDSEKRQRAAIEGFAKSAGMVIIEWFYDKAVRGQTRLRRVLALQPCLAASRAMGSRR